MSSVALPKNLFANLCENKDKIAGLMPRKRPWGAYEYDDGAVCAIGAFMSAKIRKRLISDCRGHSVVWCVTDELGISNDSVLIKKFKALQELHDNVACGTYHGDIKAGRKKLKQKINSIIKTGKI